MSPRADMKERLFDHIKKKYKVKPEYPWRKYPDYAVLHHMIYTEIGAIE